MIRKFILFIEDIGWYFRCWVNFIVHGSYGLCKVIEKMPYLFIAKYLRKYGAIIGKSCRIERGINLHRPDSKIPFKNLVIKDNVYLGHKILIDLTCNVTIDNYVDIGAYVQIWTHTGYYKGTTGENREYLENTGDVIIREGAIIYSGVIISHGLTIGAFSSVGANSLVNKSIPSKSFCAGSPAKIIKYKS